MGTLERFLQNRQPMDLAGPTKTFCKTDILFSPQWGHVNIFPPCFINGLFLVWYINHSHYKKKLQVNYNIATE